MEPIRRHREQGEKGDQQTLSSLSLAGGPNVAKERATGPKKKVAILAPVHAYNDIRVFHKEAKTLARAGYAVTLFARAERCFEEDGVTVVPLRAHQRRWRRFLALPALLFKVFRARADVYHLHNPDTLPILLALKGLGKRVAYDTHEDFAERIPLKTWIPSPFRRLTARFVVAGERLAGRLADGTIATQPDVAARLGPRAVVVENAPFIDGALIEQAEAFAEALPEQPAFRAVYAGSLNRVRGLLTMVRAIAGVNEHLPARLWLIGRVEAPEALREAEQLDGWQYVDLIGWLPHQHEVFGYVQRADAGLAVFQNEAGYGRISSNKLYEYLALGVPVIASDFPAWRDKVGAWAASCFVDPEKPEAVAEKLVWLARHPGERAALAEAGRRFIETQFNWTIEGRKLLQVYERLCEFE